MNNLLIHKLLESPELTVNLTLPSTSSSFVTSSSFYFYTNERKNENNLKCFWKCVRTGNQTTIRCSGRLHSQYLYNGTSIVNVAPVLLETDHIPVPEKNDALLALEKMMSKAHISNERPRIIMKTCQLDVDLELYLEFLVRPNNLRQRVKLIFLLFSDL